MSLNGPGPWTQPLDRIVSFRAADLSLREALDRLAAAHKLRLSYSSESLQLDRTVCVALESVPLGSVFAELLKGTGVEPIPAGGNHVVLAPVAAEGSYAESPQPAPPVVLDRIVVTGNPGGGERRSLPVAIDILEGGALYGHSNGTLTAVFNGGVPGVWLWEQSPTSLLARYGSIRGASSFGLSYPKVYVDGIQVANPLLLTRITPEAIDHIEVIRGPQGAALYGADAISGVANIVLRHEDADGGMPAARLRTGFGLASSDFSGPALDQSHVLSLRAGSHTGSATVNLEGSGIGEYIPGAYQRLFAGTGVARVVTPQTILTGTFRYFTEKAGTPTSPLLAASHIASKPAGGSPDQSVSQYTVGTNLKISGGGRFRQSLTLGIDGYTLTGVPDDRSPIPSAANTALQAARGGASRGTLQASTVARLSRAEQFSSNLTLLGEQSILYQWNEDPPAQTGGGTQQPVSLFNWRTNTGLSAQLGAGLFNHLYFTGGVRFEHEGDAGRSAVLPMIGGAWVLDRGIVTVKFRGAYGKGIRWPETEARESMWRKPGTVVSLAAEEQSGIEGGIDLLVGRSLSLQLTRYDQVATGLIQRVLVSADTSAGGPGPRRIGYQSQNVGEVTNRGWELQGMLRRGSLSLAGTASLTSSFVRRLSAGYTGDLAVGDRMLDVPSRTASLTASWQASEWAASVTAYRASDWVSYDRLTLVQGLGGTNKPARDFLGSMLRNYWITYGGVTHLGATFTRRLWGPVGVTVTGANLLDRQRGEPDNVTVLPGRTISVGVRAGF